jgi:hypothetical protein
MFAATIDFLVERAVDAFKSALAIDASYSLAAFVANSY